MFNCWLVCLFQLQCQKNTQKKNKQPNLNEHSFSKVILSLLIQVLSTIKRFSPVRPVFKHTTGDIWMFYTWNTNGSKLLITTHLEVLNIELNKKSLPFLIFLPKAPGRKCFKSRFFAEVYFCAYGWPVSKALSLWSAAASLSQQRGCQV